MTATFSSCNSALTSPVLVMKRTTRTCDCLASE